MVGNEGGKAQPYTAWLRGGQGFFTGRGAGGAGGSGGGAGGPTTVAHRPDALCTSDPPDGCHANWASADLPPTLVLLVWLFNPTFVLLVWRTCAFNPTLLR